MREQELIVYKDFEDGELLYDMAFLMGHYHDEYYNKESADVGIAECIVAKNRHGEVGTVKLQWIPQYQTFSDREWKHGE